MPEFSAEELERLKGIKDRMGRRDCFCGHCSDLRWMVALIERVAWREIVRSETEAEYQADLAKRMETI